MWPIYQTVVEKLRKVATSEDHEQQSQAAPPGSGDEFIQRVQRLDEVAKMDGDDWPRLLVFFDRIVLKDIFAALLADSEDPRAHKEAFATLKERYGNSNIEYTLHEIRG
jgi:hypothetical protein